MPPSRARRHAIAALALACWAAPAVPAAAAPVAAEIPHWRAILLDGDPHARDPVPHLRVSHANRVVLDTDLPRAAQWRTPHLVRFISDPARHTVIVWADATFESRETSTVSVLYEFTATGTPLRHALHDWSIAGHEPVRVDGASLYRSADLNFYALFDARVFSVMPIQLFALRGATFVDVTATYPHESSAAADAIARDFAAGCERIELLAAYLAEMIRAGRTAEGLRETTRHLHHEDESSLFTKETDTLRNERIIAPTTQLAPPPNTPRCDASPTASP